MNENNDEGILIIDQTEKKLFKTVKVWCPYGVKHNPQRTMI